MLCPTQTGLNSNPTAHAHASGCAVGLGCLQFGISTSGCATSGCAVGLGLVGLVDMPLHAFVEPEPECSNEGLLYKGRFL